MNFESSEQTSVMLATVEDFMRREVPPLEGEFLHGDPEVLETAMLSRPGQGATDELWATNAPSTAAAS